MELFHREYGQGEPLLILHGLFGFSDNWQTVAKALSDTFLVIAVDLRNHGRSPHASSHTYADMAEDLREFMEKNWIHSARVMGHSMGGKAAMQLALTHPDLVERLVVVDIAPGQATDKHQSIYSTLLDIDLANMAARQDIEAAMAANIPDVGVRQFLLKNVTRNDDGAFVWKMNLPVLWRYFPDILGPVTGESYQGPTLFVAGGNSDYIRPEDESDIRRLFPQSRILTIPDAGHWVHADKPAELIKVLRDFLR
ncbi:MAG: alpha/beta fold hydrolase [Saprospiraceae bacterium]